MEVPESSIHLHQQAASRFVVGLDLGTTNSAMAYVDTEEHPRCIRTFAVPQVVAPGQVEARDTLPSFHYQPANGEFPAGSTRMPWQKSDPGYFVGHFARDHGTLVPGRTIASAKSWLCHNGVDRTADLLPWQGAEDVERLSPVAVSARYLQHFREAWDAAFRDHPLADQDFVLTLPASFDEVARELTVKAARQAGLNRVVLIEEPQAAFYAWIDKHADSWDRLVSPGQKILVCDVGGGTSDFTLIRVRKGSDGAVQFHRVAVGDHLILGGDNFDLALAHMLERRIKGEGHLEPRQWSVLVRSSRQLKENLMSPQAPDQWTLTLPGSGSKLIGGGLQIGITREEAQSLLVDGFFPDVDLETRPQESQSGFQEFGLPYAPDPGITRYLAQFLSAHRHVAMEDVSDDSATDPARPDIVLFNGGVFASPLLRQRIVASLKKWFRQGDSNWTPIVLENERLDLAVARGAAYYGMVRRGEGVRIAAGLARTYYVGVEGGPQQTAHEATGDGPAAAMALCLLPAGIEPGHEIDLTQHQFQLLVSQPIEFPLYVSSTRLTDKPGDLIAVDPEQIKSLPPIRTVLKTGKSNEAANVSVILKAKLTEIGTLDLWCSEADGKRSWKLLFDVRSATQTDIAAHEAVGERQGLFDDNIRVAACDVIRKTFAPVTGPTPENDPASLLKRIAEVLGMSRDDWPTSLLRSLWEAMVDVESGRRLSPQHEARWLNLTGYSLRPGYGLAVDDWRVAETWKRLHGKLVHVTPACRAEWSILWRRIAGGLSSGQQQALTAPLIGFVKQGLRSTGGKGGEFGSGQHEAAEILRLLGACELLSLGVKHELGDLLLEILQRERFISLHSAAFWALGRVGARRPVYGPLNAVVSPDVTSRWLIRLMEEDYQEALASFAVMQLARKTGDRYRDLPDATLSSVDAWMERVRSPKRYRQLVREAGTLESEDQALIFGESLPKGLRIQ